MHKTSLHTRYWRGFLFYSGWPMDTVEAERNLKIYRTNIHALQQVNTSVLSYAEHEVVAAMIRRFKGLEKNIEQAIYKQAKKH